MKLILTICLVLITQISLGQFIGTPYLIKNPTSTLLRIGDSYNGGIIAYLLESGDIINKNTSNIINYDPSVQHGIIVARSDLSITMIAKHTPTNTTLKDVGRKPFTGLGFGLYMTTLYYDYNELEMGRNATWREDYAAKECIDLIIIDNGITYGDWYLPTKEEWLKLSLNLGKQASPPNLTFFPQSNYWTSTDYNLNATYYFHNNAFSTPTTDSMNKKHVRCIRSF